MKVPPHPNAGEARPTVATLVCASRGNATLRKTAVAFFVASSKARSEGPPAPTSLLDAQGNGFALSTAIVRLA